MFIRKLRYRNAIIFESFEYLSFDIGSDDVAFGRGPLLDYLVIRLHIIVEECV